MTEKKIKTSQLKGAKLLELPVVNIFKEIKGVRKKMFSLIVGVTLFFRKGQGGGTCLCGSGQAGGRAGAGDTCGAQRGTGGAASQPSPHPPAWPAIRVVCCCLATYLSSCEANPKSNVYLYFNTFMV